MIHSGGGWIVGSGVGTGVGAAAAFEAADRAHRHVVIADDLAGQPDAGHPRAFSTCFSAAVIVGLAVDELDAARRAAGIAAAGVELVDVDVLLEARTRRLPSSTSTGA